MKLKNFARLYCNTIWDCVFFFSKRLIENILEPQYEEICNTEDLPAGAEYFEEDHEIMQANRKRSINFAWPPPKEDDDNAPTAAPLYIAPPETQHVVPKLIEYPPPPPPGYGSSQKEEFSRKSSLKQQQQQQQQEYAATAICQQAQEYQQPAMQWQSRSAPQLTTASNLNEMESSSDSYTSTSTTTTTTSEEYQRMYAAQVQAYQMQAAYDQSGSEYDYNMEMENAQARLEAASYEYASGRRSAQECVESLQMPLSTYRLVDMVREATPSADTLPASTSGPRHVVFNDEPEVKEVETMNAALAQQEYEQAQQKAEEIMRQVEQSLYEQQYQQNAEEIQEQLYEEQSQKQQQQQTELQQHAQENEEALEDEEEDKGLIIEDRRSVILESERLFQPTPEIKIEIPPVRHIPPSNIPNPVPKEWINPMVRALTTAPEEPFHMVQCPEICRQRQEPQQQQAQPNPAPSNERPPTPEPPKAVILEETPPKGSRLSQAFTTALFTPPTSSMVPLPEEVEPYMPAPIDKKPYLREDYRPKSPFVSVLTTAPDKPFEGHFDKDVPIHLIDLPTPKEKLTLSDALCTAPDRPYTPLNPENATQKLDEETKQKESKKYEFQVLDHEEELGIKIEPPSSVSFYTTEKKSNMQRKASAFAAMQAFQPSHEPLSRGNPRSSVISLPSDEANLEYEKYCKAQARNQKRLDFYHKKEEELSQQDSSNSNNNNYINEACTPQGHFSQTRSSFSAVEQQKQQQQQQEIVNATRASFSSNQQQQQQQRSSFSASQQETPSNSARSSFSAGQPTQQETASVNRSSFSAAQQQQQTSARSSFSAAQQQQQTSARSSFSAAQQQQTCTNTYEAYKQQESFSNRQQEQQSYSSKTAKKSSEQTIGNDYRSYYSSCTLSPSVDKTEVKEVIEEVTEELEHSDVIFPPPSPLSHMKQRHTPTGLHPPDTIPKYQRNWTVLATQSPVRTPEPQELRENVPLAFVDAPKTPSAVVSSASNPVHRPVATRTTNAASANMQETASSQRCSITSTNTVQQQQRQMSISSQSAQNNNNYNNKPQIPIIVEDRAGPVTMAFQSVDDYMQPDSSETATRPYTPSIGQKPAPVVPFYQTPEKLCFQECDATHARPYDMRCASPFPDRAHSPAAGPPSNPLASIRAPRVKESEMTPRLQAGSITTGQSYLGAQQAQLQQSRIISHQESAREAEMAAYTQKPETVQVSKIGNTTVERRENESRSEEQKQRQMQSSTVSQVGNTQIERRRRVTEEFEHSQTAKTVEIRSDTVSSNTERRPSYGKTGYVANQARRLSGLEQEITDLTPQSQAITARAANLTEQKFPDRKSPMQEDKFPILKPPMSPIKEVSKPISFPPPGYPQQQEQRSSISQQQQEHRSSISQQQQQITSDHRASVISQQQVSAVQRTSLVQQQKSLFSANNTSTTNTSSSLLSSSSQANSVTNSCCLTKQAFATNNQTSTCSAGAVCPVTGSNCTAGQSCCKTQQQQQPQKAQITQPNRGSISSTSAARGSISSLGNNSFRPNAFAGVSSAIQSAAAAAAASANASASATPSATPRPSVSDNANNDNGSGSGGTGGNKGGALTSVPKRGRGIMNKAVAPGVRVPLCNSCGTQIR